MNRSLFIYGVLLAAALPLGCAQPAPPAKAPVIVSSAPSTAPKVNVETLAAKKDMVCKMDLEPKVDFTSTFEGKTYGFCSAFCKGKFEKDPKAYLSPPATAPSATPAAPEMPAAK